MLRLSFPVPSFPFQYSTPSLFSGSVINDYVGVTTASVLSSQSASEIDGNDGSEQLVVCFHISLVST